MITQIPGVRVGHWTDESARTGCTVVLLPDGTVASAEVRGGAPATRELDLLDPGRLVSQLDAVLLTGGSAFGLAAADGVVRWCDELGIGFETPAARVPIVVALGLYDLAVGTGAVRPGPDAGYAACVAASATGDGRGPVGAGTGCTVGKWRGRDHARPSGLGTAAREHDGVVVAALMAVNAYGDVRTEGREVRVPDLAAPPLENTTIGVVVTNARLDKTQCRVLCTHAHDGFARALDPVHTLFDGDAVVVAATGTVGAAPLPVLGALTAAVVEAAVRDAIPSEPT